MAKTEYEYRRNVKTRMFDRNKKNTLPLQIKLFTVPWYPAKRNCAKRRRRPLSPEHMPPLMVRKAEWRR